MYLAFLPKKPTLHLVLFVVLPLIIISITLAVVGNKRFYLWSKAQTPKTTPERQNVTKPPVYAPGEVIVKFKQQIAFIRTNSKIQPTNLSSVTKNAPQILQELTKEMPTATLEKVFATSEKVAATGLSPQKETQIKQMNEEFKKVYRLSFDKAFPVEKMISRLQKDPNVVYAEPNYVVNTTQLTTPAPSPNDPYYPEMWSLSKIKVADAWKTTKGSKNVTIAVVDTGIDFTHQELGNTQVSERPFDKITQDPLSLIFASSSVRVGQTLSMNNNRLAYYSKDKIYIYSFNEQTTQVISLPDSAPDPRVIRLALKDNILVYAADYNISNYYSRPYLYIYDLNTHTHRAITQMYTVYPFEIGEDKVIWTTGNHIHIYDIQSGTISIQTNVNTYPFQYITYPKMAGNSVAYSLHSIESSCYQAIVIHNIHTDTRQRYYPPNMGPVMDYDGNKVLYRSCSSDDAYSRVGYYLFDISTGQAQEISLGNTSSMLEEEITSTAFAIPIYSMTDEGFLGNNVVFFSENTSGNGLIAYDQSSNKYTNISLTKAAYNFAADGSRACFVSSDVRVYCHTYDTNFNYPPPPQTYFNTRVVSGYNFVENNNNPIDRLGHGTHVAGTIGASVNNGIGISGINWDASLMAIKVLNDSGSGTTSNVAKGIVFASDNRANIINMSLGGTFPCSQSQTYQTAIDYANARGVVVIVAAGNNNMDAANYSPASCQHVLAVAAIGPTDKRAYYSNYGPVVDVAAPGGDKMICNDVSCLIKSTYLDNLYTLLQGTSMATPHVSGVVGLMLATKPNLSPEEAEAILVESGDALTTDKPIGKLVNAHAALVRLMPTPTPKNSPPRIKQIIVAPQTVAVGNAVTITVIVTDANVPESISGDVAIARSGIDPNKIVRKKLIATKQKDGSWQLTTTHRATTAGIYKVIAHIYDKQGARAISTTSFVAVFQKPTLSPKGLVTPTDIRK